MNAQYVNPKEMSQKFQIAHAQMVNSNMKVNVLTVTTIVLHVIIMQEPVTSVLKTESKTLNVTVQMVLGKLTLMVIVHLVMTIV